jgi:hypothetical protein
MQGVFALTGTFYLSGALLPCFSYSKNDIFDWIPKGSVNMTTRVLLKKNRHIEDDLVLIFQHSQP